MRFIGIVFCAFIGGSVDIYATDKISAKIPMQQKKAAAKQKLPRLSLLMVIGIMLCAWDYTHSAWEVLRLL